MPPKTRENTNGAVPIDGRLPIIVGGAVIGDIGKAPARKVGGSKFGQ
jgi:hypothetical protein